MQTFPTETLNARAHRKYPAAHLLTPPPPLQGPGSAVLCHFSRSFNFTQRSDFRNMNMTDGPGRTYKYLKDESLAAFPFGFGLSLTTFALSPAQPPGLSLAGPAATARVTVTVTNTGQRAGDEVVFLYHSAARAVRAYDPRDPVPWRQLIGYERVSLAPGAATAVHFDVTPEQLSVVDRGGTRHILAGEHELLLSRGHGRMRRVAVTLRLPGGAPRVVLSTVEGFGAPAGPSAAPPAPDRMGNGG